MDDRDCPVCHGPLRTGRDAVPHQRWARGVHVWAFALCLACGYEQWWRDGVALPVAAVAQACENSSDKAPRKPQDE